MASKQTCAHCNKDYVLYIEHADNEIYQNFCSNYCFHQKMNKMKQNGEEMREIRKKLNKNIAK